MYTRIVCSTEAFILRILLGIFSAPKEKSCTYFIYMKYVYLYSKRMYRNRLKSIINILFR